MSAYEGASLKLARAEPRAQSPPSTTNPSPLTKKKFLVNENNLVVDQKNIFSCPLLFLSCITRTFCVKNYLTFFGSKHGLLWEATKPCDSSQFFFKVLLIEKPIVNQKQGPFKSVQKKWPWKHQKLSDDQKRKKEILKKKCSTSLHCAF